MIQMYTHPDWWTRAQAIIESQPEPQPTNEPVIPIPVRDDSTNRILLDMAAQVAYAHLKRRNDRDIGVLIAAEFLQMIQAQPSADMPKRGDAIGYELHTYVPIGSTFPVRTLTTYLFGKTPTITVLSRGAYAESEAEFDERVRENDLIELDHDDIPDGDRVYLVL